MTRKKFTKQLMAMGYDRNGAEAWAQTCARRGQNYEDALAWEKSCNKACDDFAAMMVRIAESIRPGVEAIVEAAKRAAESLASIDWADAAKRVAELTAVTDSEQKAKHEDAVDALRYVAQAAQEVVMDE